jgi:hypothetical protein
LNGKSGTTPASLLCCKFRYTTSCNFAKLFGIVPSNWFQLKSKYVNTVASADQSSGKLPTMLFPPVITLQTREWREREQRNDLTHGRTLTI